MHTRVASFCQARFAGAVLCAVALGAVLALAAGLCSAAAARAQTRYVYRYDAWRYDVGGIDLGAAWRAPGYDDSAWPSGVGALGFASASYGVALGTRFETIGPSTQTVYFRVAFDVADPSVVSALRLDAAWAHGFVAYLNGTEVTRQSMPAGSVDATTAAMTHVPTGFEAIDLTAARTALVAGRNVLAVELHQTSPPSDILLWLGVLSYEVSVPSVVRGPYLQRATPTSVLVRWRTNQPSLGVVRYGDAPSSLTATATDPAGAPSVDHAVTVTGLTPGARSFYSVGTTTSAMPLAGGDTEHSFVTPPIVGTTDPVRVWVIGDSGTGNATQRAVRDAYYALDAREGRETDVWLMLGDNAYGSLGGGGGSDADHQYAIFENAYERLLRTTAVWPAFGNHDWADGASDPTAQTGPYFDVFSSPRAGEAGGVASGSEAYYSFDHGNVHFVCMNTQDPVAESASWLESDLAATTAPWIIGFFHVPPYTHGTHDSDAAGHAAARAFGQMMEAHGADLVLTGHSHDYERSILLDGLDTTSDAFVANPALYTVNGGDGRQDGDGAYTKPAARAPHQGTVYVVDGNSGGRVDTGEGVGPLDHPVMVELTDPRTGTTKRGLFNAGSLVLDIDGARLDARYIDQEGAVLDHFTILKGDGVALDDGGARADGGVAPDGASALDAGPSTTAPIAADGGCGCLVVGGAANVLAPHWAWAVVVAVVAMRRRRRRCRRLPSAC